MNSQNQAGCYQQTISPNIVNTNIFYPYPIPKPNCQHPHEIDKVIIEKEDDSRYIAVNNRHLLDLQILISQLIEIKGITSLSVRRLLSKYFPNHTEGSSFEDIKKIAESHIFGKTREMLFSELENINLIMSYICFHKGSYSMQVILNSVEGLVNHLKRLVNQRINEKLMENQGFGNDLGLDERVLSLKTPEELVQLLEALKKKELQEMVDLNFAPYRAQRVVTQDHLNCTRMKILDVEKELRNRERRKSVIGPCIGKRKPYFDAFYS